VIKRRAPSEPVERPARVLVVDDEPVIHELVREIMHDYDIVSAETAAEARAIIERGEVIDVSLVDKNLPDVSGLELVKWLRTARPDSEVVLITAYPSMDSALEAMALGAIDYLIKPMRDINELRLRVGNACARVRQRRAETKLVSALRESEERHRELFEAVPDAVLMIDAETREICEVNTAAERLYGRPRGELVGRDSSQLTSLSPPALVRDKIIVRRELRADGTSFPVEVSTGCSSRDGRDYVVEVVRDVSDRERADAERVDLEKRLSRASRLEALGRLAAGIAHDVNNMLCVIRTNNQLASEVLEAGHAAREDLEHVEQAVVSAADLTRSLLAFSGRQLVRPQALDLNEVVHRVMRLLGRTLEARVKLVLDLAAMPVMIKIDPGQLEQVLTNLAVNARDAMPHGGTITIATRVEQTEPRVWLSVRDTGGGIPKEILGEIFEPFFTTKGAHGTGIGLATVREIVSRNEGLIDVQSSGEGTRFDIRLPWSSDEIRERSSAVSLPIVAGRGERLLIVEDDVAVREATRRLLAGAGYAVQDVRSAEEAIEIVATGRVQLVFADIDLPGISGVELAHNLDEHEHKTPIVFTSGMASDPNALGARPFLPKPYSASELLLCVRSTLDRWAVK